MARLCCYVSGHGFGHSARVQALVEELLAVDPSCTVEVRTSAPRWFYEWLLGERCSFSVPPAVLDPGVVQRDSFTHEIGATLAAWHELLAHSEALITAEAEHLDRSGCRLVLSDVVPLACAAAARAGLPVVVLGNFTWDWILEGYLAEEPAFAEVIAALREQYRTAALYLRLPLSPPTDLFASERALGFLARRPRVTPARVRERLGLEPAHLVVLLSFGGFGVRALCLDEVARFPAVRCLWDRGPAQPPQLVSAEGLGLHYSDLVGAADVILTKPGYSIIAEAVTQQKPLVYVPRAGFREQALLEPFLRERWPALPISLEQLATGRWIEPLCSWAQQPRRFPALGSDGAREAAELLLPVLG